MLCKMQYDRMNNNDKIMCLKKDYTFFWRLVYLYICLIIFTVINIFIFTVLIIYQSLYLTCLFSVFEYYNIDTYMCSGARL